MNWISILLVALTCVHAFAAPEVLPEDENGVGNDLYSTSYRDQVDSEYTKLRDSFIEVTPQGRAIVFVSARRAGDSAKPASIEDSGESASTEESDESPAPTKHSETKSESASTEESNESISSEEDGSQEKSTAAASNDDEHKVEDSIAPKEETALAEQPSVKPTNEVVEVTSANPAEEVTPSKPVEIVITAKPKPPKKPKPARATTMTPLAAESVTQVTTPTPVSTAATASRPPTTDSPTRRYPCRCGGGLCSCCTGLILENFNVPIRSRACANITYEPDDFAFNFKLSYNDRILYNNRMSAKNPRPACIPINRYFGVKMCAKLSNVYMSGRNVHACLDLEGFWDEESAFQYSFNCFRIGTGGVALVRPEDGGGLPPPPDEEPQTNEDYDDSARGWTSDVQPVTV